MTPPPSAKQKILDSALTIIRAKGYEATTVEDLCQAAGVTKGAFFHHFTSKEDLAVAAAEHWSGVTGELFRLAPYHRHDDPLDRVLGYLDFRKALIRGTLPEFTCLVGTMVQETFGTHPAIREASRKSLVGNAEALVQDIDLAKKKYAPGAAWTSRSLALHTQAVIQGAFILSKACDDPGVAMDTIDHLRRYLECCFKDPNNG